MFGILFWLLVGAFIGWNVPQPPWAVNAEKSVRAFFVNRRERLARRKASR